MVVFRLDGSNQPCHPFSLGSFAPDPFGDFCLLACLPCHGNGVLPCRVGRQIFQLLNVNIMMDVSTSHHLILPCHKTPLKLSLTISQLPTPPVDVLFRSCPVFALSVSHRGCRFPAFLWRSTLLHHFHSSAHSKHPQSPSTRHARGPGLHVDLNISTSLPATGVASRDHGARLDSPRHARLHSWHVTISVCISKECGLSWFTSLPLSLCMKHKNQSPQNYQSPCLLNTSVSWLRLHSNPRRVFQCKLQRNQLKPKKSSMTVQAVASQPQHTTPHCHVAVMQSQTYHTVL